jgi:circadian clock protein KaiB
MIDGHYQFRLFVAGDEPNSVLAERNLRALCCEFLVNRHQIEVVDVVENFEAALQARIMVAPTLLVLAPRPLTLLGALSDKARVLKALGILGVENG